jgi:hypothetical protein
MRPLVLAAVLALVAGCAAKTEDPSPPAAREDGVEMVNADDGSKAPEANVASVRRTTSGSPAAPEPLGESSNDPWQSVLGPVPDPWQPPPTATPSAPGPACPGSRP